MKYTTLPGTDIKVSTLCLGTMTWGEQNTEAEGHKQMDYALEQGINFFDTAELYPIPSNPKTQGSTETFIGNWMKKNNTRNKIVLATKITGPAAFTTHIRTGGYAKEEIIDAIHKSLIRLQTDYIDLYQLHWPERNTNFFGKMGYDHDAEEQWKDNFNDVLQTLNEFVKAGKIRHIGVSNETPFGVMRFLEESERHNLPRIRTIQNPYSLLNRTFEVGNAEVGLRKNVGLLAYSPLGFGVLSGKYLNGQQPEKARITLFPNYKRYSGKAAVTATERYVALAKKHQLSPVQMALAFVNEQPFVTANIIGATSMEQLKENIGSIYVELTDEIRKEIATIHREIGNPAP